MKIKDEKSVKINNTSKANCMKENFLTIEDVVKGLSHLDLKNEDPKNDATECDNQKLSIKLLEVSSEHGFDKEKSSVKSGDFAETQSYRDRTVTVGHKKSVVSVSNYDSVGNSAECYPEKGKESDGEDEDGPKNYNAKGPIASSRDYSYRYNPWSTSHESAAFYQGGVSSVHGNGKHTGCNGFCREGSFKSNINESKSGTQVNYVYGMPSPDYTPLDYCVDDNLNLDCGINGPTVTQPYENYFQNNRSAPVNFDHERVDNSTNVNPKFATTDDTEETLINAFLGSPVSDKNYAFENINLDELRAILDGKASEDVQDNVAVAASTCNSDNTFYGHYESLTPPKSVSPAPQEDGDVTVLETEDLIGVLLNGIDDIHPNEMSIYLGPEKPAIEKDCLHGNARKAFLDKCDTHALERVERRLKKLPLKEFWEQDRDGDMILHVACCQKETSPSFYEKLFYIHTRLQAVWFCCNVPVGDREACSVCGQEDETVFYTPLSFKNNQGFSPLSCALHFGQPEVVINFMLEGLCAAPGDMARVFDANGKCKLKRFGRQFGVLMGFLD